MEIDANNTLFDYIDKNMQLVMPVNSQIKITQLINIMTGLLTPHIQQNLDKNTYEKYFVFSLIWGFGGLFDPERREQFHKLLEEKKAPLPSIPPQKMAVDR